MTTSADTKARLISAAETLFAANGIQAVSLREIVRASGARNTAALQYHFGDRAGLVRAVLAKHDRDVDARRNAMLDADEGEGGGDLWKLAAALVQPLAAQLADEDGGPAYLQMLAELMNQAQPAIALEAFEDPAGSLARWRMTVAPLLSEDALRLHRRFVVLRFAVVELARRADTAPHTDDRLFASHLVDLTAALLGAPASAHTLRLAAVRDQAQAGTAGTPV